MIHKKHRKRSLKPSSYAFISELAELEKVIADLEEEEAEKRMREVYSRLDAIALEDPKEATAIYNQSPFFWDDTLEDNELYLTSVYRITKQELATELNTPEKRAAYIAELNRLEHLGE